MTILDKSRLLKKELSLFNIYTIAAGATIASGFFLLPGIAMHQAGPAMIISYFIAAIPVVPALLSNAELATAMPRAGGVYYFLDRSMGPLFGTIGGIGTWLAITLKAAFALVGIGAYAELFFPDLPMIPLAIGFAILFAIVNYFGAKKTGVFQSFLVIGLLGLLIWFSVTGLPAIKMVNFRHFFARGSHNIISTAGLVYVSYVGLSKIASVSEEVKNPERTIPLGMFLALGTAVLIYLVGTIIMVGVVPAEILSNDLTPVATTAKILVGPWGEVIMIIAAILAFFSVANAGILSASRYPLAMSRDHLLPRMFASLSSHKTPPYAILITVGAIILILVAFDATKIAKLASAFQLLLFALINLAVIVMRESHIDAYDPGFRSPLYPWMQIFGFITPFYLIYEMGTMPTLFSLALIAAGVVWYFQYARSRIIRDGAIYHIFARLGQRRFEGLDRELRGILKEKGLREQDPFDAVVAGATIIDLPETTLFEEVVYEACLRFEKIFPGKRGILSTGFMQGTRVGATPVSKGAALPHFRLPDIPRPEMVMVRTPGGVIVDIDDEILGEHAAEEPVYAFFFLVSPEENPGQHLRILAQIAGRVDDEKFIRQWLTAKNEQYLKEILLRDDRFLSLKLIPGSQAAALIDKQLGDLELPEGTLVALIRREGEIFVPSGRTTLKADDRLTIIGSPRGIQQLYDRYHEDV